MRDDDLQDRLDAYAAVRDGEAPARWTPEWVQIRLVRAFRVIHFTVTISGPAAVRTGWPAIVRALGDDLPEKDRERIVKRNLRNRRAGRTTALSASYWERFRADDDVVEAERDEVLRKSALPTFTPLALDLADEAIAWPLRYLSDAEMDSDALQLWALSKALGFSLGRALAKRRAKADAMIAERLRSGTPGAVVPALAITRAAVMPQRAMTEDTLERRRKSGAALVAGRLHRDRVQVR